MYTLLRERYRLKDLLLQLFLLIVAFALTEVFVEYLVERQQLFPESFLLESSIFMGTWFISDSLVSSIVRGRSVLRSFLRQGIAQVSLFSLVVSLFIAELFFKFHNFGLELLAMLGVWFALDFLGQKLTGRSSSH